MNEAKNNNVVRLRTINKAVELIKEEDPGCQITSCMVRKAIRNGDFKARRIGSKYLVDVDSLVRFFSCTSDGEGAE